MLRAGEVQPSFAEFWSSVCEAMSLTDPPTQNTGGRR
jgi:hypothetical protein